MTRDDANTPAAASLAQLAALAPLNIIRSETVLSRLPVHNLAKKGRIDIRIVRCGADGGVQLKWEVSYSERYGQPRQLAYKLDTLIVNRRLDEQSRPLPTLIRIGSLKEICRALGLQQSGKNTRDLRAAFLQNASAFINARLVYRGTDGAERSLEAGFTRYGVVFTGEKLPDGRNADAVYITLNQPYWEVVNSAPVRPLDYDYLKALTPAAQRFYEVISFRIYAALRNGRNEARMAYGDYCLFSAQQRYYDYEHMRAQMRKIHAPHLASGYLKSVSVEPSTDGEGKPDWTLVYTPGPKARAEHAAFSKKHTGRAPALADPVPPVENADRETADPALAALLERGISERQARKLIAAAAPGQRIADQIEWADFLVAEAGPGAFRNPPGFYVSVIRDNVSVPVGFDTSRKRLQREAARRADDEREQRRRELELRYEQHIAAEVERAYAALGPADAAARVAARRETYARQFPNLPAATLDEVAASAARRDLQDSLDLVSFEEFAAADSSR